MRSRTSAFNPRVELVVFAMVLVISACTREEPRVTPEPNARAEVMELQLEPEAIDSPAVAEVAPEPTPEPESQPPEPLDLSLPTNLHPAESDTLEVQQAILPDMFQEKAKKEPSTRLSGKLLLDEENPDAWQSVNGAEITVERKLD